MSTIKFWEDLVKISEDLKHADPKIISLRTELRKMNEQLPAAVYIPFLSSFTIFIIIKIYLFIFIIIYIFIIINLYL